MRILQSIRLLFNCGLVSIMLFFFSGIATAEKSFNEEQCIPQAVKICVDESEKIVDGFQKKECWKYREVFRCTSKEENNCSALEANRGCNEIRG